MVKIGITGSNNTGKTTLAYNLCSDLRKKGFKAEVAHESVRTCPIGTKSSTTIATQLWIFAQQMKIEEGLMAYAHFVITDKTVMDTFCYGAWFYDRSPTEESSVRLNLLRYIASAYSKTYDVIFLSPINDKITVNLWYPGVDHRKEIDSTLRSLLHELSLPYEELPLPLEKRCDHAFNFLKDHGLLTRSSQ